MESIKDFILQSAAPEAEEKEKVARKKASYEVVFATGCDFAIRKKTAKKSDVLVVIVSQEQYYLKHESTGGDTVQLNEDELSKFVSDFDECGFEIKALTGEQPNWINILHKTKFARERFLRFLYDHTEYHQFVKHDMFLFNATDDKYAAQSKPACMNFKTAKAVFDIVAGCIDRNIVKSAFSKDYSIHSWRNDSYDNTPDGIAYSKACSLFKNLFEEKEQNSTGYGNRVKFHDSLYDFLNEKWGISGLRQIIKAYFDTPVTLFPEYTSITGLFIRSGKCIGNYGLQNSPNTYVSETKFDLNSFVDYLFCEATAQGSADNIGNWCDSWKDYLDCQMQYYGSIRDKYSEQLMTDERKVSYQLGKVLKITGEKEFSETSKALKEFCMKGENYTIIVPETTSDLVEESRNMSNCLASYVSRVIAKECFIFFCRRTSDPDKSFVDIEIRSDFSLGQVKARFNHEPDFKTMEFVNRWYHKKFGASALTI